MTSVLVIIPTYNEAANLAATTTRLRTSQPAADILIVDDNSPDGTGAIADALAADSQIHVLHRNAKQGLGRAYLAGFDWGLRRGYQTLVEMDADGSHQPEQLAKLLAALDAGADLALGSRWVPGGTVLDWPQSRSWLSRAGNAYARAMLGLPVRDATSGFRAYRRETLTGLRLAEVRSQGYCFQLELIARSQHAGYHIAEVPITFVERAHGNSKMDRDVVLEALWRVTGWGLLRLARRPWPGGGPN